MNDPEIQHGSTTVSETAAGTDQTAAMAVAPADEHGADQAGAEEGFMMVPEETSWPTGPLVLVLVLSMLCVLALMQHVSSLAVGLIFAVPVLVFWLWLVIRSTMRVIGPEEDIYPDR
jgi:hypothetical protein